MEKELLYRYFNGHTSKEEDVLVMEWAEASQENRDRLEKERLTWLALMMYTRPQTKAPAKPLVRRVIFGVASAATAVLLMFGLFSLSHNENVTDGVQIINVPSGQRTELILSDGTKVWLNSGTRLEYPTSFGTDRREVRLHGEGYFDVARNEDLPFIVHTQKYDVEVLGTVFNVVSYDNPDIPFETSLISGSVRISSGSEKAEAIVLKENQYAVEVADGSLQMAPLSDFEQFSWKDGVLSLTDVTFSELIAEFGKYYDVTIELKNPSLADKRCTGKFRNTDGVVHSLNVLKILIGFEYEYDVDNSMITIR